MSKIYSIGQFAKQVGKSISTPRRRDASGEFIAKKHHSGHKSHDETDVIRPPGIDRKKSDSLLSVEFLAKTKNTTLNPKFTQWNTCPAPGIAVDEWKQEIGGGTNFKRKKILKLTDAIQNCEISKLLIAHKDRLVRFGFEYFEHLTTTNDCQIIIINQKSPSPQQMVEDLMALHTHFPIAYTD